MLHDATIHKGVIAGFYMGPSWRGDASDAERDERRDLFKLTELFLADKDRAHDIVGVDQEMPANIFHANDYKLPCKTPSGGVCSGNGFADLRNMDFEIPNDDPLYHEKIMLRFKEYIISGQCEVCQQAFVEACKSRAERYNNDDEMEEFDDVSVGSSEEDL